MRMKGLCPHATDRWDWHNRHSAQDVDGNSEIAPLDALHILNALSNHGAVDTQELDRLFATDEILSQPARIAAGSDIST